MQAIPPIIVILGPTAAGKTRLAIDLARRLPGGGECVGCDSMQVYRGMDVGTAKPTPDEQAAAPHHLLDVADPADDAFSVDRWLGLAEQAIAGIRARARWPIVVGGTNLYVKALLEGLFDGPPPDPQLRATLATRSIEALRAELVEIDPESAARIHANDRRRTIRAIEVYRTAGRPISELQQQWDRGRVRDDAFLVGLDYPVEAINRRINARVRDMVAAGLFEEVRALAGAGALGPQAREALGYRQVLDHLEGRCSADEAVEQIKIRTRRFAKQQRTWLRRFRTISASTWIRADVGDSQAIADQALAAILAYDAKASRPSDA
jgi:tRNA dimethylallyltransferase